MRTPHGDESEAEKGHGLSFRSYSHQQELPGSDGVVKDWKVVGKSNITGMGSLWL